VQNKLGIQKEMDHNTDNGAINQKHAVTAQLLKNESSRSPAISFATRANLFLPRIPTILLH